MPTAAASSARSFWHTGTERQGDDAIRDRLSHLAENLSRFLSPPQEAVSQPPTTHWKMTVHPQRSEVCLTTFPSPFIIYTYRSEQPLFQRNNTITHTTSPAAHTHIRVRILACGLHFPHYRVCTQTDSCLLVSSP